MSVALESSARGPLSVESAGGTNRRRAARMNSPVAPNVSLEELSIAQRTSGLLLGPWKNYLLPARVWQRLMASSPSPLLAESFLRPGGWRSMELMYANAEPLDWLDRQALRDDPMSKASRNRLRIVTARLASLIAGYAAEAPVTVLGVGAGPGRHVQTSIVDSGVDPRRVTAHLFDLNDDAFEHGRALSRRLGIEGRVHFRQGGAWRTIGETLPDTAVQIVKLVGIVENLNDAEFLELLGALSKIMVPGATLVTHGLVDPHGGARFRARVFHFRHRQRTARKMQDLLLFAGFRPSECVTEPIGIYPILTAVLP
ncbi:MAG: hypothetical protein EXS05_02155 [Planctomycetaceae bacterium]|nr:hypothetical protein [Planctomycetaceae bacterium]